MTDQKQKPLYRVMCARVTGYDRNGNEQLGRFCQIGAVWAAGKDKKWPPVSLDITPQELTDGKAALFLQPVEADNNSQA